MWAVSRDCKCCCDEHSPVEEAVSRTMKLESWHVEKNELTIKSSSKTGAQPRMCANKIEKEEEEKMANVKTSNWLLWTRSNWDIAHQQRQPKQWCLENHYNCVRMSLSESLSISAGQRVTRLQRQHANAQQQHTWYCNGMPKCSDNNKCATKGNSMLRWRA